MSEYKTKIYTALSSLSQLKWTLAAKGLLTGAVAGLLAVFYRMGIEYGTETAIKIYAYFKIHPLFIIPWVLGAGAVGVFVAWLIRLEPMANGSGIPQVEGVVLFGMKMKWNTILAVRFLAGFASSFFGLSLGREGPSIQIGAAGGQAIARNLRKSKLEENYLITGGAAAGLAAAFNAPLSGMVFALEEVHRSFSPLILLSATTASLTADFVSKYFFGLQPVLSFTAFPEIPIHLYYWLIPVGLISGLIGSLINKSLLWFQTLYGKLPDLIRPGIAMLIALPCGMFFPLVLGSGQDLIKFAETTTSGISILVVYLVVKLLFTSTSFGSGIPGGIFMPILAVGTLSGSIVGILASHVGLPPEYISDLAVCAMAGALSASVKAPVTSILLTAEMAGSLTHMLPVAACSFLALLLSDLLHIEPIYEALLERYVENTDDELPMQKKGGLLELPVEFGCDVAGKKISEIEWPNGALIVGVRRGEKELVPRGDTQIMPGDYLVILSTEENETAIRDSVRGLCRNESC
ncbi:ClC family H(+)/Cl(-) exchange transporter [Caproicibacter sp.]|uniref:ClC family H(+)/Cl(-) exchange transporter n=1 Tax=Caproicibacter sp. TaxID=2814884 RepID=UPI003988CB28